MIKKTLIISFFAISLYAQQSPFDQNQFMLAQSYEQRGDLNKAIEIIEPLLKKDPANIQYFNKLNSLYLQLKKYDESVSLINSRILLTPQDITLYGMLGSTYYTAGDRTKAYEIWDNAAEKFKENPIAFRVISNYVIEKRDFEKAIELLNHGKRFSKDPYLYSYDLAELYNVTMRYRDAAEEYCSLIRSNPSQYAQIENKILSYSSKPSALDETIEIVNKYKSDNIAFSFLLARLYTEKKNYDKAFDIYKQIEEKQNSRGSDLFSFADYVFREGEYQTAANVYKYLIDHYPEQQNIQLIKLGYAKTKEALLLDEYNKINQEWKPYGIPVKADENKIEPVIEAYEEIVRAYQHSEVAVEANLRIGILLFHLRDDIIRAENYLKIIINNYPTSKFASLAFVELGNISLQKGNLKEAEQYFTLVNKLTRANSEDKSYAQYQLSRILAYIGDFENARLTITAVLGNLRENIANDAIEFSVLLNTAKNDSSNLSIYCKAEFLTDQHKYSEAKELYTQLSDNTQAFVFHSMAKLKRAEMLIADNNFSDAIEELKLITDEGEKNIYADKALYLQGQIYYYGLKDTAKAVESFESLLARFPKSLYLDQARQNIIEIKNKIS